MNDLTLVTALFDLGRHSIGEFSRTFNHYLECFSKLLKLDFPMVIFCDDEVEKFVWQHRKPINTKIIHKTVDDLKKFPFYNKVQEIRNNPRWYNQAGWLKNSPQAMLELYNPLVMSKFFYLHDATLFNPFQCEYFAFIDAGLSRTVQLNKYFDKTLESKLTPLMNKMLFIGFPYDGNVEVHGFEKQAMNKYAGKKTEYVVRGGFFGGSKEVISEMNGLYYSTLSETLNSNLMGTEESILTILSYKYPNKINLKVIESNGLIYKFFEDLNSLIKNEEDGSLAIYSLTYNLPEQFKLWIESFKTAFPKEFSKLKKYVINNSDDKTTDKEYNKIFKENGFEVIHKGRNIGINDGRWLAAKHFDQSKHSYYLFVEDDFLWCAQDYKDKSCKSGFIRWIPDLFNKSISILENEKLDYLKLSYSEFFGTNEIDWSWYNVPEKNKKIYFPEREDGLDDKLTKVDHISCHRGLSYAIASFGYHYANWPLIFNKSGNKKVFLDTIFEFKYEQTMMSHVKNLTMNKKIKSGCLLASPIEHNRMFHYPKEKRKENKY